MKKRIPLLVDALERGSILKRTPAIIFIWLTAEGIALYPFAQFPLAKILSKSHIIDRKRSLLMIHLYSQYIYSQFLFNKVTVLPLV